MNDSTPLTDRLRAHFEARLPYHLEVLEQMVSLNSLTRNPAGVDAVGALTIDYFEQLGFLAERIPAVEPEFGDHLVLTRTGRPGPDGAPAPIIGLVSHLDTVFSPEEEAANDFRWRPQGDRIYGPGTVDIKGGTILIGMILEALQAHARDVFESATWVILFDSAEETGGHNFGPLCRERLEGARACLVFEGGTLEEDRFLLVTARKGMVNYTVSATGRASHAGTAHPIGANAIVQLAKTVRKIADMTDYERKLTFNVGTIRGGTVVNRVPHLATADVEMRTFERAVYDEGIAGMLALADKADVTSGDGEFSCEVQVHVTRRTMPWPSNSGTDGLYEIWAAAGAEIGIPVAREERGGLSDGNHMWSFVPTLDGLGPSGGNAHCSERTADGSKDQEYVLRSSFVPKALLNTTALLRLIEGSSAGA